MSDLMISMVNDVVINDITRAMMTSPHVIHTIPNNFECNARGTRSPYLTNNRKQKMNSFLGGNFGKYAAFVLFPC